MQDPEEHRLAIIIGRNIKTHRILKGWSQEKLATAINVAFQQLQK